jgi:hypothetical protein
MPDAPKKADEPTATTGIDWAELGGANVTATIASASSALQIFHLFIKLLLSDLFLPCLDCGCRS